ncbi:MAG: type IV secretory system conjugative DNA transfer family protein [Bacteroidota bacterium]
MEAPTKSAAERARESSRSVWSWVRGGVTRQEERAFWEWRPNRERRLLLLLVLLGGIAPFWPVVGAIWGFWRGYHRILEPKHRVPHLAPLWPGSRYGLIVGILIGLVLLAVERLVLGPFLEDLTRSMAGVGTVTSVSPVLAFFVNASIAGVIILVFEFVRRRRVTRIEEGQRFGTARFASDSEIEPFKAEAGRAPDGFYIGTDYTPTYYAKQGHLLTVAGTRGGKGVNLIIPNLLGAGGFSGSWVVIDPKGENAAVTARWQRDHNRKNVVLLNPWGALRDAFAKRGFETFATFNPLDLVTKGAPENLVDDVDIIAEMLVPIRETAGVNPYFTSRARAMVAAYLLHLVTTDDVEDEERTLPTLWAWLRSDNDEFTELLGSMDGNEHPVAGTVVQRAASEIASLKMTSTRVYSNILSTAQDETDFLKSPALTKAFSEASSFDLSTLSNGDTVVYVIIPPDRLKTHYKYLRLVATTLLRGVIRHPNRQVCFLLDEAYALGYISEIDVALGTYAGYGVSLWNIFQNLTQVQKLYGKNWENVLAQSAVRHFFNLGDQSSRSYISAMLGTRTVLDIGLNGELKSATGRPLLNPDEVGRGSKDQMFTFIEQDYPTYFPKQPYYTVPAWEERADDNPLHKG